jgi:DNA-binding transcriptional MerR regulator
MFIRELAQMAGVPAKTIRYYESIGLLPRSKRAANNYRQYTSVDVERLRFIASARALGFSLNDIAEIIAARDKGIAPCRRILGGIAQRLNEVDRRIADLLSLRDSLRQLQSEGAQLPLDDVRGERCVCYLLKAYRDTGGITIQKGDFPNV